MAGAVTLRRDSDLYKSLKSHAEEENRTFSNFIETAA